MMLSHDVFSLTYFCSISCLVSANHYISPNGKYALFHGMSSICVYSFKDGKTRVYPVTSAAKPFQINNMCWLKDGRWGICSWYMKDRTNPQQYLILTGSPDSSRYEKHEVSCQDASFVGMNDYGQMLNFDYKGLRIDNKPSKPLTVNTGEDIHGFRISPDGSQIGWFTTSPNNGPVAKFIRRILGPETDETASKYEKDLKHIWLSDSRGDHMRKIGTFPFGTFPEADIEPNDYFGMPMWRADGHHLGFHNRNGQYFILDITGR